MDELIAFITARLDDDEQIAWAMPGPSREHREAVGNRDYLTPVDPARVLADVAAKRKLLDWLQAVAKFMDLDELSWWRLAGHADVDEALRLLALPYAGHPDFQAEWRAA